MPDEKPNDTTSDADKNSAFKENVIRLVTVFAYVSSVSMGALCLSSYYVFFWEPKPAGPGPPVVVPHAYVAEPYPPLKQMGQPYPPLKLVGERPDGSQDTEGASFWQSVWSYIKPGDPTTTQQPHIITYTTTKRSSITSDQFSTDSSPETNGNGSVPDTSTLQTLLSITNADDARTQEDIDRKLTDESPVPELIPSLIPVAELETSFISPEDTIAGYAGVIPDRRKRGMKIQNVTRDANLVDSEKKTQFKVSELVKTNKDDVRTDLLNNKVTVSNEGPRHNGEGRDETTHTKVGSSKTTKTTTETVHVMEEDADDTDTVAIKEFAIDEDNMITTQSESVDGEDIHEDIHEQHKATDQTEDVDKHEIDEKDRKVLEYVTAKLSVEYKHGLYDNDDVAIKSSLENKGGMNDNHDIKIQTDSTVKYGVNVKGDIAIKQSNEDSKESEDEDETETKTDGEGKHTIIDIGTELPEYLGTINTKSASETKYSKTEELHPKELNTVTTSSLDPFQTSTGSRDVDVRETRQNPSDLTSNTMATNAQTGMKPDKVEKRDLWTSMIAKGKELLGNEELTTGVTNEHTKHDNEITGETKMESTTEYEKLTSPSRVVVTEQENKLSSASDEPLTTQVDELNKEQTLEPRSQLEELIGLNAKSKPQDEKVKTVHMELTSKHEPTIDRIREPTTQDTMPGIDVKPTSTETIAEPTRYEEKPVPEFYNQFQHHMRQLRPRRRFPNPHA